jgi:Spy/CpxP family protein refolding chaperone
MTFLYSFSEYRQQQNLYHLFVRTYFKKTSKGSAMKQFMIAVMLSIGIGSVAMSVGGEHGQRFDWDQLDLTDRQAIQVQAILKTYREDFQRIRKYEIDALDKKRQMLVLRDAMVANVEQVLSAQQRVQANIMIVEQAEKRIISPRP